MSRDRDPHGAKVIFYFFGPPEKIVFFLMSGMSGVLVPRAEHGEAWSVGRSWSRFRVCPLLGLCAFPVSAVLVGIGLQLLLWR